MKKFLFTPGEYLFYTGLIYFTVSMCNALFLHFCDSDIIQMVWVLVLMVPVFLPVDKLVRGAPLWKA